MIPSFISSHSSSFALCCCHIIIYSWRRRTSGSVVDHSELWYCSSFFSISDATWVYICREESGNEIGGVLVHILFFVSTSSDPLHVISCSRGSSTTIPTTWVSLFVTMRNCQETATATRNSYLSWARIIIIIIIVVSVIIIINIAKVSCFSFKIFVLFFVLFWQYNLPNRDKWTKNMTKLFILEHGLIWWGWWCGDWWLSDGLHQSWQSGNAGVVDDTVGILATTHKYPYHPCTMIPLHQGRKRTRRRSSKQVSINNQTVIVTFFCCHVTDVDDGLVLYTLKRIFFSEPAKKENKKKMISEN